MPQLEDPNLVQMLTSLFMCNISSSLPVDVKFCSYVLIERQALMGWWVPPGGMSGYRIKEGVL